MKTLLNYLIIVVLILVVFTECNNVKKEKNLIKIGAILPLTGKLSAIGEGEKEGLLLALDSLKLKYPDWKIELQIEDFMSETKNALGAANKLIDIDKVDAIITSTTAAAEVVSPIVQKNGVVNFVISPDVEILEKSNTNYRVYYNFFTEARIFNNFFKNGEYKSISFLAVKYASIQKMIEERIEPEINGEILGKEFFDISQIDFKNSLTKASALKPNLLFLAPQVNQVEPLSNQIIEGGYDKKVNTMVGSFTFNWKPLSIIGKIEGLYLLSPKVQVEEENSSYQLAFSRKLKRNVNFDVMYAYDNLMILSEILVSSNNNKSKFESLFNNHLPYVGASGKVIFKGGRDTDVDIVMTQIRSGKQVLIP